VLSNGAVDLPHYASGGGGRNQVHFGRDESGAMQQVSTQSMSGGGRGQNNNHMCSHNNNQGHSDR
jgi:hypothetical protein